MNKDLILREKLALQRTILANQTTLLSFVRTALYFLVAGLSIRNLLKIENSFLLEILLFSSSLLILLLGLRNYLSQQRKIKDSEKHIGDYQMEYLAE
jgi:putative membrane protein